MVSKPTGPGSHPSSQAVHIPLEKRFFNFPYSQNANQWLSCGFMWLCLCFSGAPACPAAPAAPAAPATPASYLHYTTTWVGCPGSTSRTGRSRGQLGAVEPERTPFHQGFPILDSIPPISHLVPGCPGRLEMRCYQIRNITLPYPTQYALQEPETAA